MSLTAAAALAGAIGSGAGFGQQAWSQDFQSKEAQKTREFSAQQASLGRDFNASQAQLARDFSERMDSTAYQRHVQDMQKAGLNPALLAGGISGSYAGGSPMGQGDGAQQAGSVSGGYAPASVDFSNILAKIGIDELASQDHSASRAAKRALRRDNKMQAKANAKWIEEFTKQ